MQIIDGKLVAKVTREQIKQEVEGLKALNYPNAIGLAVILVGDDPASQVYVRNKIKACDEVGIKSFLCKLPAESTFDEVAGTIRYLNENPDVSGMILQLPLPKHLDENSLLDLIDPEKDVDGCHYVQKGRLWTGRDSLVACTPYGVMKLLEYYDISLQGKSSRYRTLQSCRKTACPTFAGRKLHGYDLSLENSKSCRDNLTRRYCVRCHRQSQIFDVGYG